MRFVVVRSNAWLGVVHSSILRNVVVFGHVKLHGVPVEEPDHRTSSVAKNIALW